MEKQQFQINFKDFETFSWPLREYRRHHDTYRASREVNEFFGMLVNTVLTDDAFDTPEFKASAINRYHADYKKLIALLDAILEQERRERHEEKTIDTDRQAHCETVGGHESDAGLVVQRSPSSQNVPEQHPTRRTLGRNVPAKDFQSAGAG